MTRGGTLSGLLGVDTPNQHTLPAADRPSGKLDIEILYIYIYIQALGDCSSLFLGGSVKVVHLSSTGTKE